jgi:hypothetical protein
MDVSITEKILDSERANYLKRIVLFSVTRASIF